MDLLDVVVELFINSNLASVSQFNYLILIAKISMCHLFLAASETEDYLPLH